MSAQAPDKVLLLGLDVGSTTSSMLIAEATLQRGAQGTVLRCLPDDVLYRPAALLTPFAGGELDELALGTLLDHWIDESAIAVDEVFAGGALVTGLAAQSGNIDRVERLVADRLGEQLVANAGDPTLESWLAFMGSCGLLSRSKPDADVINLDIGGGTTNPALGRAGEVQVTGCAFIGARHWQFEPGSARLLAVTPQGQDIMQGLGMSHRLGDTLSETDVARLCAVLVESLEALVTGGRLPPAWAFLEDVPFEPRPSERMAGQTIISFSGGVGELIYAHVAGEAWPPYLYFGDLGVALAQAIVASPILARDIHRHVPEQRGRATVTGLALNSSDLSGASLYLPDETLLPLRNLPVVGVLHDAMSVEELTGQLSIARGGQSGISYRLSFTRADAPVAADIRRFGKRLAEAIQSARLPLSQPLVLLLEANMGKVLGNYVTDWGQTPLPLLVIDEIPVRDSRFVNIGTARNGTVPVTFYGLNSAAERDEVMYASVTKA